MYNDPKVAQLLDGTLESTQTTTDASNAYILWDSSDVNWFQESLNKKPENPFNKIEIEPEWYGVSDACHDFAISILSGFIWEAENTTNFNSFFPKMVEIKALLHEFVWLKKIGEENSGQYWPGDDDKLRLAFVKFAMMIPKLWD